MSSASARSPLNLGQSCRPTWSLLALLLLSSCLLLPCSAISKLPHTRPTAAQQQHTDEIFENIPQPEGDCPLRVAFLHSEASNWVSSKIATDTWSRSLEEHIHVAHNPANVSSFHVAIVVARDPEADPANLWRLRRETGAVIGMSKAYAMEQELAPLVDFAIVDNTYVQELFLLNGVSAVRLPSIELVNTKKQATPYDGNFDVDRPALLCYHGDRSHLNAMAAEIVPALNRIHDTVVPLKLRIIHGRSSIQSFLSKLEMPYEDVKLNSSANLQDYLADCDLGLVPQADDGKDDQRRRPQAVRKAQAYCSSLRERSDWFLDGILTYKRSANAGRAFTFALVGVPVIADATPHVIEHVLANKLGYVAERRAAWELYIKAFLTKPRERKAMARRTLSYSRKYLSASSIGLSFIDYLVETFASRLPGNVVESCRAYLNDWEEFGSTFESVRPTEPLDVDLAAYLATSSSKAQVSGELEGGPNPLEILDAQRRFRNNRRL